MNRIPLFLALCLMTAGCATVERLNPFNRGKAMPASVAAAPVGPGTAAAASAETFDQTTPEQRSAALAGKPAGTAQALGKVVVALGSPTEQGFWLRSALVTAPGKGRVVTANGTSVAVELQPGTGPALLSLAAFRALELPLTGLPEVTVLAE
jgi:hypothetical protein